MKILLLMLLQAAVPVSQTVKVTATVTDDSNCIGYVQLQLDGSPLGPKMTAAPYEFAWDTKLTQSGNHALKATAADCAGNTAESNALQVRVDNQPPTIELFINGVKVADGLAPTLEFLQARFTPPRDNKIEVRVK